MAVLETAHLSCQDPHTPSQDDDDISSELHIIRHISGFTESRPPDTPFEQVQPEPRLNSRWAFLGSCEAFLWQPV
jgi:hypothetical protein